MLTLYYFLGFGFAGFAASWVLLRFISQAPRWRRLSRRTSQLHHGGSSGVPRFGGVALAAAFVAAAVGAWLHSQGEPPHESATLTLILASLAMFAVGLIDDVRPLGAKKKLMLQMLVGVLAFYGGLGFDTFRNPITGSDHVLGLLGLPATLLWLVGMTNLVNFIDGIDGLAGGICLMLMGLLVYIGWGAHDFAFLVASGMGGAVLAFLRYNFPPARVHMGDGGAYLLGFLIAGLSIVNSHKGSVLAALLAPMFALGLPIADTGVTLLRRALAGLPLFRADRFHTHHRLIRHGFTRRRAVLSLYGISVPCLLLAFSIYVAQERMVPLLFGLLFLALALGVWRIGLFGRFADITEAVTGSMNLRKESRYALVLVQWLELEAERCSSVQELWQNFGFLAGKFGFASVKLRLEDGEQLWQSGLVPFKNGDLRRCRHEVSLPYPTELEFTVEEDEMRERPFVHLAELAAEGWVKAASRWHQLTGIAVRFDADTTLIRRRSVRRKAEFPQEPAAVEQREAV